MTEAIRGKRFAAPLRVNYCGSSGEPRTAAHGLSQKVVGASR